MKISFEQQMDFLKNLAHFTPAKVVAGEYEFSLDAISELLSLAGNPQNRLKIIHVAGTNGKGSTIAFLSKILISAGYRVGVYTSPALVNVTEQIRINDSDISKNDFAHVISLLQPHIENMRNSGHKITTEFETITVAALLYFLDNNCDFVLLECGLGGESDATNVIPTPLLSVIASIGLDHTEILGDTLEKIAMQKAGIIKRNGTVVVIEGPKSVMNVFKERCQLVGADIIVSPIEDKSISNISLGIKGAYQKTNASLAKSCALALRDKGYQISDENILQGLSCAQWPCRFEIIGDDPVFVIDGSHNIDGVKALTDSLISLWPNRKFRFIVGILKDKAYKQVMEQVIPIAHSFYTVTVPSSRALSAKELADYLLSLNVSAKSFDLIESAVDAAIADASNDDIICAFGSLYYVGKVREYLISK